MSGDAVWRGELADRINRRRDELGLSAGEVARRAGIDTDYLEYLEHRPSAALTGSAMLRLAAALGTTVQALIGEEVDAAPDRPTAEQESSLAQLSDTRCRALLEFGGLGRIVFQSERGPVAYPVNFTLQDGAIVLRTSSSNAAAIADAADVGFEIDRFDEARREGWSVLATGRVAAQGSWLEMPGTASWAPAERDTVVRIEIHQITGRALTQKAPSPTHNATATTTS